jgi:hypothetical protein
MKAALAVIGVIIILLLFGTMIVGINSAQTTERTDTFVAPTAVATTEADVVLVADPWNNDILNISEITSSLATDAPLPDSYVGSTNTLTVRGLTEDTTRTLTIVYVYGSLSGTPAATGDFLDMIPVFVAIAAVLIIIAAIWASYKNR